MHVQPCFANSWFANCASSSLDLLDLQILRAACSAAVTIFASVVEVPLSQVLVVEVPLAQVLVVEVPWWRSLLDPLDWESALV